MAKVNQDRAFSGTVRTRRMEMSVREAWSEERLNGLLMSLIASGLLPFRWKSGKFIISFSEIFDRVRAVIFQSIKSRVDQIVKHSHKSDSGLSVAL